MEALHVRLFLPPAGLAEPAWPMLGTDGMLQIPPPEGRPAVRKYTIRRIDVGAGTLAIDFVVPAEPPRANACARTWTGIWSSATGATACRKSSIRPRKRLQPGPPEPDARCTIGSRHGRSQGVARPG